MSVRSQEYQVMDIPVSGTDSHFNTIVENWTGHLQYISSQITRNKQVAEDIVQEAFLLLWQQRKKIIAENPAGWLIKVVTNLSLRYLRDKHIRARAHNNLSLSCSNSYSEVEEQVLNKERHRIIAHIIDQLPLQQKVVFHLSKEKGLNRSQIASFLRLSPNTVKVHLSRAKQFMRENLVGMSVYTMLFIFFNIFFTRSNTNSTLMDWFNKENINATVMNEKQELSVLAKPKVVSNLLLLIPIQSIK